MTPEGKVKAKIKAALTAQGIYFFMPRGTVYGRRGVPDIVLCINGRFVAIEVKAGRGKTTKLQELEHERIRQAGGVVFIANETNYQEVLDACTKSMTT